MWKWILNAVGALVLAALGLGAYSSDKVYLCFPHATVTVRLTAFALALACMTTAAAIADDQPVAVAVDWRALTLTDLAAARSQLLDNTPGSVAGVDPMFRARIARAYGQARQDASKATSPAGYRFTLERFVETFQDNHLRVDFRDPAPAQWPGFMVGYRQARIHIVVTENSRADPIGAVLIGCDRIFAGAMAEQNLAHYVGRWSVPAARRAVAPYLLVDQGNPFVTRPTRCTFAYRGRAWNRTLNWRAISAPDLSSRIRTARNVGHAQHGGVRLLPDGGYWLGLPTLNALNPSAVAELESLMGGIDRDAPKLRAAPYVVIDLRGDKGGNTFVALRVLNAIWGSGAVGDVRARDLRAEWRASGANLGYLSQVQPMLGKLFGEQSTAYTGLDHIIHGMTAAIADGRALYVDPDEYALLAGGDATEHHPVRAKAYLLTDGDCESSCLNLVDLARKLPGAVQIGDETGADTLYLENRPAPLPSGRAVLELPMKHYRNRERGQNVAYSPALHWRGDMGDDHGLEAWIAGFARHAAPATAQSYLAKPFVK